MNENIYNQISSIYSHLMRFIDYEMWANYIYKISKQLNKKNIYTLELASGNCKLAYHINKKFKFYVASDLSKYMLLNGSPKVKNKICCNFLNLPIKIKFDFIFSCFDSVNYLTTKNKFLKMLSEVDSILNDDGIFTFDVSMENNSLKYQKYLNRKGIYNNIKYEQISRYNSIRKVHQNKFLLEFKDGTKIEETHIQKIYSYEEYFEMISKSNFYVSMCYEAFSFKDANPNSERIQFVLKKRNQNANIQSCGF
ncbi:MAG: class I SAM-dependent methyltransferase [Melioribacteraceae bacterium]|nr:class I SAM-dependent methyltransferase [Melioribacteraceae bacterium]